MDMTSFWYGWNASFSILAAIIGFIGPIAALAIIICVLIIVSMLLVDGIKWAYDRSKR